MFLIVRKLVYLYTKQGSGTDQFISEKEIVQIMGFMILKSTGSDSRFQPKMGFILSPKILPKKCQKLVYQTKPAKFDTFWPISRDSVHIFQNRYLR